MERACISASAAPYRLREFSVNSKNFLICTFILCCMHLAPLPVPAATPVTSIEALRKTEFGEPVVRSLELMIERGTDRYGEEETPMWMAVLDAKTVEAPREPEAVDEHVRVIRRGRRAPGGCNFLHDQPTLRVAYALSELSGDGRFQDAADAYLREAMTRCVKPDSGFFVWGWHTWYDAFDESFKSDSGDHHELHLWLPDWERLYALNPEAVLREVEAIWKLHVCGKETGEYNRHGDGNCGLAFAMSGAEFIYAFMEIHRLTGDMLWKERAQIVSNWHWNHRDEKTGLTVNVPEGERFDGKFCDTAVIGLRAGQVLLSAHRNNDRVLLERAMTYLKAYAKYGYDAGRQGYYGMVRQDGEPLAEWPTEGYDQYAQPGLLNLWEVYVIGYAYPLPAAQAYAHASGIVNDPDIRQAALRWADWIGRSLPANEGRGTYADQYGRCISLFREMHRQTGDEKYRKLAVDTGREALKHLDTGMLLRSHPNKPYWEAVDGIGLLLHGLLELALDELEIERSLGFNM